MVLYIYKQTYLDNNVDEVESDVTMKAKCVFLVLNSSHRKEKKHYKNNDGQILYINMSIIHVEFF